MEDYGTMDSLAAPEDFVRFRSVFVGAAVLGAASFLPATASAKCVYSLSVGLAGSVHSCYTGALAALDEGAGMVKNTFFWIDDFASGSRPAGNSAFLSSAPTRHDCDWDPSAFAGCNDLSSGSVDPSLQDIEGIQSAPSAGLPDSIVQLDVASVDTTAAVLPEPKTMSLMAFGLVGIATASLGRRRQ